MSEGSMAAPRHRAHHLVSRAWRRILKVDEHWPTELLYLAKEDGGIGLMRLSDLIHMRKLALVARFDQPDTLGRTLMSSILGRNLNLSFTTPPLGGDGQLREGAAPTWTTWLSGWLPKSWHSTYQALLAEALIYALGVDAPPVDYREYGLTLQAELGDGGEVRLRAAQCWLKPGSSDQKRTACEILSFKRGEDGDRAVLLSWERPGAHPLQVGDAVRAHEESRSGMHRGAGTDYSVPVASLLTTSQQLVYLTKDWHSGEHTCRTVMAILDKQVTPPLPPPPSALSPMVDLLAGAETVYTDGSYKVVGTLLQRIRGTATQQASASIVAKGYDGSYKALRKDLTGKVDSAATAELVGAAVAGAAGTDHRDQVTDCKSILAIEARARAARPLKFHQRVLLSSAKTIQHKVTSVPPGEAR